ncbi:PAS domain-containing protein [Polyangium aurulentum]|uniref:PAS domain-containing protein n=1 Tax=Polyangium aurulentum TaxID=2567896 RepID=UPI00146EE868|nr:PAS domain-containing protein [Polyangium aurulentum]UQA54685.1 PAS domain-containing protein [Polyangium aurulentum]
MTSGFHDSVQAPMETEGPVDALERLAALSQEEVDDLPYGFVVLDGEGKILLYNRYESRLSRLSPERVIGKNFFKEVAPCTRVEAFYGRFLQLVEREDRLNDAFRFRFYFLHGVQDVAVQFVKAPPVTTLPIPAAESSPRVFMTVVRRPVVEDARGARGTSGPDLRRTLGSIGGVLPVLLDALPSLLERIGPMAVLELGEHVGRALALVIATEATDVDTQAGGGRAILAPGALDGALARAGLGRLSFEDVAVKDGTTASCVVRPPFEMPTSETALFYGAMLAAAIGTGLGQPHRARCIDDPRVLPWHFEITPGAPSERPAPPATGEPDPGQRTDGASRGPGGVSVRPS